MKLHKKLTVLFATSSALLLAGSLQAAVVTVVTDSRPGETAVTTPSATVGSVSYTPAVPTTTYTVSSLDLSSYGGGVGESIAFDVTYTHGGTGGTGVQVNGFGNISVTGGDNNQVDNLETLTATVSFNTGSSTFSGDFADLSIGFTSFSTGGVDTGGNTESWQLLTDGGTSGPFEATVDSTTTTFPASSFVTLDPVSGVTNNGTFNLQGFDIEISAIPEPSSAALLGGLGLLALLRRRR